MKPDRFLLVSGLLCGLAAAPLARATTFYSGVKVSTTASQFYTVNNLVQGAGVGFDAAEPHDALGAGGSFTWVTNACGGGCNYYDTLPTPVLVFDLGADVPLGEISVWGYADSNTNGTKEFSLRFATAAEGTAGFGSSIAYNPTFSTTGYTYIPRESYPFDNVVTARYVELTCVNNYFGEGPGGDRVGLGEVAFPVTATAGPADISVAGTLSARLTRTGVQTVTISVLNTGGSDLFVTDATLSGPNSAAFSVVGLPGAIPPVGTGTIELQFDPTGVTGSQAEVTVSIVSNDPDESPVSVAVTGLFNRFYPIASITATTEGSDLYPVGNLIQGEGVGFSAEPPYDRLADGAAGLWVTAACGFPCDYLASAETPVLVLDLGEDVLLTEISTWGYSETNSNGVSLYSLRFATEADGITAFGSSVYNPTFDAPNLDRRTSHQFSQPVTARYVEFTCLDNYFGTIAGGDRMGLGEIGFEIVIPPVDAALETDASVALNLDGTVQSFTLPVRNGGQQNLAISSITFTGPNAAAFSLVTNPGNISSLVTSDIAYSFNPAGLHGPVSATMTIVSNDPASPHTIPLSGILHDPFLSTAPVSSQSVPAAAGAVSLNIPITNTGASQTLNLTAVTLEGPEAGFFAVSSFPASLSSGQSGQIALNLDPMGVTGVLRTSVVIISDDPLTPTLTITAAVRIVPAQPLIAWWPLDDDGTDLSGNGHDGTVEGSPLFGNTGANGATGSSAQFFGFDSINVPYDPALNPTSYTVTLWVQPLSSGGGSYRSPITNRDDVASPSGVHGFIIYNDAAGNWSFWTGGGGVQGSWDTVDAGPVTVDQWVHLAISYDEITGTKTFYLNGAEVISSTGIPFSPNGPEMQNLHIGSGSDLGDNFYFDGFIDDVALFSVPLSPEEIGTIAANGVAAYAGVSGPPFRILNVVRNATLNEMSLIWESQPNASYSVYRSFDLSAWTSLANNIGTQGDTTEFVDTTLPANTPRVYYRIGRNP